MSAKSDNWYRTQAQKHIHRDGEIEVDDNALVSTGADAGAYVAAWVWVDDPEEEESDDDQ